MSFGFLAEVVKRAASWAKAGSALIVSVLQSVRCLLLPRRVVTGEGARAGHLGIRFGQNPLRQVRRRGLQRGMFSLHLKLRTKSSRVRAVLHFIMKKGKG